MARFKPLIGWRALRAMPRGILAVLVIGSTSTAILGAPLEGGKHVPLNSAVQIRQSAGQKPSHYQAHAGAVIRVSNTALVRANKLRETVYIGSFDHNVYALDAHGGQKIWSFTTRDEVEASPTVAGGVVYVGSNDHNIYALDARVGRKVWSFRTGSIAEFSTPTVVNNVVYVGSDDRNVYALNAHTGREIWSFQTGDNVPSSPAVVGDIVYIGSNDHSVYALDARTGEQLWRFPTGDKVFSSPKVVAGVVYVGSYDHNIYAIDARTGRKLWSFLTGDLVWSSPAVARGAVYVGSADKNMYALDSHTGHKLWSFRTGGNILFGPRVVGNTVYFGSEDDNVYALDARTGERLWSFQTGDKVDSAPAVVDGVLYIGSHDGNVYALDARNGQKLWGYHTGGFVYASSPAVAGAGSPTSSVSPACCGARYFPQSGHNLKSPFLAFWQKYGGVATFGYPRTEPLPQNGRLVQYTDRFLLEWVGNGVTTAPLGRLLTLQRSFPPVTPSRDTRDHLYFSDTGHSLSGRFLTYWRHYAGSFLLGSPISEVIWETDGDGSGRHYQTQWFERGTLEYHPELAHAGHDIAPGPLGIDDLKKRGWLS